MTWRGLDFFPRDIKFQFMRWKHVFFVASMIINVIALFLLYKPGLNFSIDFKGGTLIEVRNKSGAADLGAVRETLGKLALGDVQVQGFGEPSDLLVRIATQAGGDKAQQEAIDKVRGALGDTYELRRTETVGPAISGELRQTGTIAVLVAILGIAIYVWFRFEWQFALGGVAALLHDALITLGVFTVLQLDFDISVIAAILLIIGYSINDTVVVFDRVRENLRKYKQMPLDQLIDLSINETLSRTVLTATTTAIALLILYLFGSEVIKSFTFAMLFGVIIGTYSSIFVASAIVMYTGVTREWGSGLQSTRGKANASKA